MKVSKALSDVWEWKDEIYEEIKDMNSEQRIAYFREGRKKLEEKAGRRLDLPRVVRRDRNA